MAGVTLSAAQTRFAWQVWYFLRHHRCQRKLGDELGRIGAVAFYVAGVTLSAPQARFAWQAWHFQYLHRCPRKLGDELGRIGAVAFYVAGVTPSVLRLDLRGRHGTFCTTIDVSGSLATNWGRMWCRWILRMKLFSFLHVAWALFARFSQALVT